jgi:hypothetical protein
MVLSFNTRTAHAHTGHFRPGPGVVRLLYRSVNQESNDSLLMLET